MIKLRKVLIYIFGTFFFVLVLLIIIAAVFEKKIVKLALDQVSTAIDIPIEIDDIAFTLIHDFPYATIQCENLKVSSPLQTELGKQDTLFFAESLFVSVASKPLLKGVFEIRNVELQNAVLFYQVDTAGLTNFDFLMDTTEQSTTDTTGNAIFLDMNTFTVENFRCEYTDKQQKASASVLLEELTLSGLIDNNQYMGAAEGLASLSNCTFDTTKVYLMNKTLIDFNLDYKEETLSLNRLKISVDEDAIFSANGLVRLGDELSTELNLITEKLAIDKLTKYVPESYLNDFGIQKLSGLVRAETSISGVISDSIMPMVETSFDLSSGGLQYQEYPELKAIAIKGNASNGTQQNAATSSINIQSLSFKTDSSKFSLSATVKNLDKPSFLLNSTAVVYLDEFSAFIPDSLLQSVNGKIHAEVSTKGVVPDSISDAYIQSVLADTKMSLKTFDVTVLMDSVLAINHLNSHFEYQANEIKVQQLNAFVPAYNFKLKNVDAIVVGNPLQPDSLTIRLNQLQAAIDKSSFEFSGTVKNPMSPNYSVAGKVNLNLEDIATFVPDSLINSMSGNVMANFQSAAHLNIDSIDEQMNALLFEKSNFTLKLENVNVDMPDTTMNVNHLSGQLEYHSDTFNIDELALNYQGINFGMNTVMASNVYSAVLQNQAKELLVIGKFNVGDLDYAFLEQFMELDSSRVEELEEEPLNFTYKIKGRFKGNNIQYGDALFQNVDTKFLLKPSSYIFDSLQVDAFDGQSLSSVKIEMLPEEKIDVYFKTDINKMDVSKMVKGFWQYIEYDDFKPENVQGSFSTQMDGKIVMQNFEPVYNSLLLNGDLTVENGALINVKPIMEVQKIKGIGLKNMDSLYFNTLSSSVFLFNRDLYIPRTEIKSSSFDAMFLGMYSFGEDYEYHIRMFLGEVLSSKSKANLRKQAQDSGFGQDVETDEKALTKGRTSIYVVSKSIDGKEKAGFDKKRDRSNMRAKVNLQKQMVDMRFHPALVKYNTEE